MEPLDFVLIAVLGGAVTFSIEYLVSRNIRNRILGIIPLALVSLLDLAFLIYVVKMISAVDNDWDLNWAILGTILAGIVPIGVSVGWLIGWSMGKEDQGAERTAVVKRILIIGAAILLVIGVLHQMR